jgi:hypothetical protein
MQSIQVPISGIETQGSGNRMQMESILCPNMHTELTHDRAVITQCALKVNEVVIENANSPAGCL